MRPEKVELHQARLLHPFHVELGHRHVRFRIAIERHQFGERTVADHDAGGVGRGMARQALELARDSRRRARTTGSPSRAACSRGSSSMARGERNRIGRILRHELAQLVDLAVGHLQHAADVAQHAARLQRAEGDDLRDLIAAVAFLHIADHLVAAVLAEIDIEVRHRHALGIEEAFEQQPETDRIEIGDRQRVGHERARARAAAGPDRDAVRLRPLDEVGDDQEVAGIFHAGDDIELEGETVAVVSSMSRPGAMPCSAIWRSRPACARLRSSAASSTAPSPAEKRGRIGACVRGRNAQRCAISTRRCQRLRQCRRTAPSFRRGS